MKTELKRTEVNERSLERVKHWPLNPRYDVDDHGEDLDESLERCGLMDKIHVWVTTEADWVLRGNRRLASMLRKGWPACGQVLVECADERDALLYCLEDVGNTVPLTVSEKIDAVRTGVKVGLCADELAGPLALSSERVQLYFDLGTLLPAKGREALHEGRMAVETAEMIVKVEDEKLRAKAIQMVLQDALTREPLAPGMARAMLEQEFLRPQRWEKEWTVLEPKLKKKLKVIDGYQFVTWKERDEYVQGPSGQPNAEYELADTYMPKDKDGRTWEQVAKAHGAPVFVCPAPMNKCEYVLLVSRKMVKQAAAQSASVDSATVDSAPVGQSDSASVGQWDGAGTDLPVDDELGESILRRSDEADESREWLRERLGAIYEALMEAPTDAMGKGPWEALMPYLATQAQGAALEAWRGITTVDGAKAFIEGDRKIRWYLRQALLLLLCGQYEQAETPEMGRDVIEAVAESLGLGMARE